MTRAGQLKLAAVEGPLILQLRLAVLEGRIRILAVELAFAAEASAVEAVEKVNLPLEFGIRMDTGRLETAYRYALDGKVQI